MNRRIREPYVRWCERRTVGFKAHGRLLDYPMFNAQQDHLICIF